MTEKAMKRIKYLDKLACAANSLWEALEALKRQEAEEANISDAQLRAAGVFVPGDEL